MRHLDLCSGIGGFKLAAGWAGFETIGFSEVEPFCCRLLKERWPLVRNYGDLRGADFSGLRGGVDVLSAGVPCQPASLAGKRRGASDDRWLWPATLDVVECVQPAWCIFENPVGILSLDEFGGILLRLGDLGYEVRLFGVPANAVGAKHRRQRVFIVANRNVERLERSEHVRQWNSELPQFEHLGGEALADAECRELQRWRESGELGSAASEEQGSRNQRKRSGDSIVDSGEALADADRAGLEEQPDDYGESEVDHCGLGTKGVPQFPQTGLPILFPRLTQSPLCRRTDGIPDRSHRLKALGNAVVPQQAWPFFAAIAQTQRGASETGPLQPGRGVEVELVV